MKALLLGCGNSRRRVIDPTGVHPEWDELVTLDIDPDCGADVVFDLDYLSTYLQLPFEDGEFDEIHAYEVLEHVGRKGDWRGFFNEFAEYHRVLKRGGHMVVTCPRWDSPWAWGDPGHTRVLSEHTFAFLSQANYEQVGSTAMTDYRGVWKGNFQCYVVGDFPSPHSAGYVLEKL